MKINNIKLILLLSMFFLVFGNYAFFSNVLEVYPFTRDNGLFILSLGVLLFGINTLILSLLCFKYTIKPVSIILLLCTAMAAYFMDSYNVVIDEHMIDNILKTDMQESLDTVSIKQIFYLILLGVIPALLILRTEITYPPLKQAIFHRVGLFSVTLLVILVMIFSLGGFYASFFREHKPLRYYTNPGYYLYSLTEYFTKSQKGKAAQHQHIGEDAIITENDEDRELIIIVVGESARADHFSLNGYQRETNPKLAQEDVISFTNVWACGTSTAVSVPCLFSIYPRSDYNDSKARNTDNLLDIIQRAGVNVIWLDNNSDSKGVAERVPYQSFKSSDTNPVCGSECRDEGMLTNLQRYIDSHTTGDIVVVLHQMGNHGPAYYKRYPTKFEKFSPTCKTNQLEKCSSEEIRNSYDNAILYTDYFLSRTINLLKANSTEFEAAMIYISDHGESLGEKGMYLHGLPYAMAPDAQTHVPLITWFSESFEKEEVNKELLKINRDKKYSHDNFFHTIFGILEVESSLYDKQMNILADE